MKVIELRREFALNIHTREILYNRQQERERAPILAQDKMS